MGLYHLDLDALSEYTGISVNDLKLKSFADLESRIKKMNEEKIIERNNRNAKDEEYERLVLKYFRPVNLLRNWFDDKEIVLACARTGITERDLCTKTFVKPGNTCVYPNAEFIRTSVESVPQFDGRGNELLHRINKTMDVYRISNPYQGIKHGDVILETLYERYPELKEFKFDAYGVYGVKDDYAYELYPKSGIYTPFAALMSGNVDAIIHRNREYCRWFNNGRYSPKDCENALHTEEVQKMFAVIHEIGKQERDAGHMLTKVDRDGNIASLDGMEKAKESADGQMMLLQEPMTMEKRISNSSRKFRLEWEPDYTVGQFIEKYFEIATPGEVTIHVYDVKDWLGEKGLNIDVEKRDAVNTDEKSNLHIGYGNLTAGFDCTDRIVYSAFGWKKDDETSLIIRIE